MGVNLHYSARREKALGRMLRGDGDDPVEFGSGNTPGSSRDTESGDSAVGDPSHSMFLAGL